MTDLIIATFNSHKAGEIKKILPELGFNIRTLSDFDGAEAPEENGKTVRENALIKARAAASFTGGLCLADDTALEVRALGGAPGIYSARYAGTGHDAEANNLKLLGEMSGKSDRAARFLCCVAVVSPGGGEYLFEGELKGDIAFSPRGSGGFGYDPLFIVSGTGMTVAEIGEEKKNGISHRSRALRAALPLLLKLSASAV